MDAITFRIPGDPVPQPRARVSTRGGKPKGYTPAGHPIHVYRQAIQVAAMVAARLARHDLVTGPVVLEVLCVFARPPSHLNKAGQPRATAALFPPRCDWDNLGKGVSDAITDSGAIWRDDEQVVDGRVRKRYARPGEAAGTIVTVRDDDGET